MTEIVQELDIEVGAGVQPLGPRPSSKVKFESTDPQTVSVSPQGLIHGVSAGTALVSATLRDNAVKWRVTVR